MQCDRWRDDYISDCINLSQDGGKQKLEKAKITLNDCLACSGCITSAESVLITQQSHEELFKVLQNNKVEMCVNACNMFLLMSLSITFYSLCCCFLNIITVITSQFLY